LDGTTLNHSPNAIKQDVLGLDTLMIRVVEDTVEIGQKLIGTIMRGDLEGNIHLQQYTC